MSKEVLYNDLRTTLVAILDGAGKQLVNTVRLFNNQFEKEDEEKKYPNARKYFSSLFLEGNDRDKMVEFLQANS